MNRFLRSAALGLVLVCSPLVTSAQAQSVSEANMIFKTTTFNLNASGETILAPDMATISLGVITKGGSAAAALRANTTRMSEVVAALKAAGIERKDIQTSGLSIQPQYDYSNSTQRLTGYQASNQVTIVVRNLDKLGDVVDATVKVGANNLGGVTFGLQNPQAAEDAARQNAVKALMAKADLYAKATGYRVARIVSLSESGGFTPPSAPVPMMAMARMAADAAPTPVEGGELRVRMDVSATFEMAK
jgi:uncharacterized protein YggE